MLVIIAHGLFYCKKQTKVQVIDSKPYYNDFDFYETLNSVKFSDSHFFEKRTNECKVSEKTPIITSCYLRNSQENLDKKADLRSVM